MDNQARAELDALIKAFDDFVKESLATEYGLRAIYLNSDNCTVYVRKQLHPILPFWLCIARVNINEHMQGKGIFSGLLTHIENNLSSYAGVEFECIQNERLAQFLKRNGYNWSPSRLESLSEYELHLYKAKA